MRGILALVLATFLLVLALPVSADGHGGSGPLNTPCFYDYDAKNGHVYVGCVCPIGYAMVHYPGHDNDPIFRDLPSVSTHTDHCPH